MPPPLRIGVLLLPNTQLLDLSCIDLLSMADPAYLSACNLPPTLTKLGHTIQIHYIGPGGPGTLSPVTSNINMQLTASPDDPHVSPGNLDAVLIAGTDPNVVPDETYLAFIRRHHAHGTQILSVCTGSYVVGHAGIVAGKVCTGPRLLVPMLREKFPDAKEWVQSVRVVRDGNLWTSGAITNGHDLIMQYLSTVASAPLVNTIAIMADLPARSIEYESSVAVDTSHFVWQIIRAVPSMLYWGFGK